MALAALSRKNALMVEPIRRTWRKSSSYSYGRNLTVTLTVRPALSSVSVIQYPAHVGTNTEAGECCHAGKYQADLREIEERRRGDAATGTTSASSSASSRPDHEDIGTVHRTPKPGCSHTLWSGSGAALLSLHVSLTALLRRGCFTGPQMDPELRLLDLVRRDWWVLVIVLCIIWAIECHLEGNSVIETISAPLLVVAWGALIFLLDRWVLRRADRRNG
jgi:hypothetical protein